MALANHKTPFDVGVHTAFSETSLRKVPDVDATQDESSTTQHLLNSGTTFFQRFERLAHWC